MAPSEDAAPGPPLVSVVLPVRDEARDLAQAVAAVLAQDYPGPIEVVLSVAPSSDGTEDLARDLEASDSRIRVVGNPAGSTSAGLNVGIAAASGDVVVRVDGHAALGDGYVRRAVELLETTGADNVGGVQMAVGETPFERAVAAAMTSRFGTGDAKFHYGGSAGPTDTVYLGVFRRSALDRVGGFDESLVRNQDYEMNWRIRHSGGVVWFDPDLRVRYRPRGTLRSLARQYFEYGQWKRVVLKRHPKSLRWRQMAPPLLVVGLVASLVLAPLVSGVLAFPLFYAAAVVGASVSTLPEHGLSVAARLPLVFATMHLTWGTGFLLGPRGRPSGG
jgi:glycosyltransferase involved in cell wall biosynthesis